MIYGIFPRDPGDRGAKLVGNVTVKARTRATRFQFVVDSRGNATPRWTVTGEMDNEFRELVTSQASNRMNQLTPAQRDQAESAVSKVQSLQGPKSLPGGGECVDIPMGMALVADTPGESLGLVGMFNSRCVAAILVQGDKRAVVHKNPSMPWTEVLKSVGMDASRPIGVWIDRREELDVLQRADQAEGRVFEIRGWIEANSSYHVEELIRSASDGAPIPPDAFPPGDRPISPDEIGGPEADRGGPDANPGGPADDRGGPDTDTGGPGTPDPFEPARGPGGDFGGVEQPGPGSEGQPGLPPEGGGLEDRPFEY